MTFQCPAWESDVPLSGRDEFAARLGSVFDKIRAAANRSLICDHNLREWHQELFENCVPLSYYAGNFRQNDPARPCLGINVVVGGIQGADFSDVQPRMTQVFDQFGERARTLEIKWISSTPSQRAMSLAETTASIIGDVIRVHPFINGNGRISRLVWFWMLERFGVAIQCQVFPRPRGRYEQLMADAMQGDYAPLLIAILAHLATHAPKIE